jgi:hypothetical protein
VALGDRDHFPHLTEGEVVRKTNPTRSGTVTSLSGVRRQALADGRRFGCDRLSVSFPVSRMDDDPEAWPVENVKQRGTANESWSRGRSFTSHDPATGEVGKVSVFVGVTEVQGKLWGKVEANPSRFIDPAGCDLLPLDRMQDAINVMANVAQLVLEPACPVRHWRVKRVDMARDFRGIGAPEFYVRGLLNVHRPHARQTYIYSDPTKNSAQTLWAGNKSGGARLYDQHEAYADKGAPQGSLRWEVEARGGHGSWLEKVGITSVEDLVRDQSTLCRLAETRWEWSGMGRELASISETVQAVKDLGLTPAKRQRLLGALMEDACGSRTPSAKETEAEYRKLKAALGFTLVPMLDQLAAEGSKRGRLDWESGTEIAA